MKIEIDLTEQQIKFLKEFAEKHYPGATDNVCTNMPIHAVETRRERVVDVDFDSADKVLYIETDNAEYQYETPKELAEAYYEDRDEECSIPIVSFDEAYSAMEFVGVDGEEYVILSEEDYFRAYGIKDDYCYKVSVCYYYEPVAFFFILDEAKRYMQYQRHNLNNPKTFSYSPGYSNCGDYEHFYTLLRSIGIKLNELDK